MQKHIKNIKLFLKRNDNSLTQNVEKIFMIPSAFHVLSKKLHMCNILPNKNIVMIKKFFGKMMFYMFEYVCTDMKI